MSATPRVFTFAAFLAVSGSLLLAAPACVIVADDDNTLTVQNDSSLTLTQLYVTEIDNRDWGGNLLDSPLRPGDSVDISVSCGTYDTRVVDRTGAFCEDRFDLCLGDSDLWVFSNSSCTSWEVDGPSKKTGGDSKTDAVQPGQDAADAPTSSI